MATKNEQKEQGKYFCKICDYDCYKKYNYERHILTAKHIKTTNSTKNVQNTLTHIHTHPQIHIHSDTQTQTLHSHTHASAREQ